MEIEQTPTPTRRVSQVPNSLTAGLWQLLKANGMKVLLLLATIGTSTVSAYLINNKQIQVLNSKLDSANARLDAASSQIDLLQTQLSGAQSQITKLQAQLVFDQTTAAGLHSDLQVLNKTVVSLNIAPLIATGTALTNQLQTSTAQFTQQTAQLVSFNNTATLQMLSLSKTSQAQVTTATVHAVATISSQRDAALSVLAGLNDTIFTSSQSALFAMASANRTIWTDLTRWSNNFKNESAGQIRLLQSQVTALQRPKVRAIYYASIARTMSSGIATYVDFDAKVVDNYTAVRGAGSGSSTVAGVGWEFVAPVSGYYVASAYVAFPNWSSTGNALVWLSCGVVANRNGNVGQLLELGGTCVGYLSAGTGFQVYVMQNSGSTQNVYAGQDGTYIEVAEL